MNSSKTNIQVSRSTRDALAEIGKKGESYDDIIILLLQYWNGEPLNRSIDDKPI